MRHPSKLGREELEELIDLWRISPEGRRKIRAILAREKDLRGPHLFRYYGPGPSKVAEAEKLFGEVHRRAARAGGELLHLGAGRRLPRAGHRHGRRGHRPRLHLLRHGRDRRGVQRDPGDRRRGRHADARSEGRGAAHHGPDAGHRRGPHARRAGADGRDHADRAPAQAGGGRGRGAVLRRVVSGQETRRDRRRRLLQLRLLQNAQLRRGRLPHHRRRMAIHARAELARHGRLLAARPLRRRTARGRAVLRRELPHERTPGRRGARADPQGGPVPQGLPRQPRPHPPRAAPAGRRGAPPPGRSRRRHRRLHHLLPAGRREDEAGAEGAQGRRRPGRRRLRRPDQGLAHLRALGAHPRPQVRRARRAAVERRAEGRTAALQHDDVPQRAGLSLARDHD